ncbi:MAG: MBL fold metallo-hydrolase [Phycisphaerae bacterium]|nr:MBL fold metallo-hydrolase [Phycisphaerae bacterium]
MKTAGPPPRPRFCVLASGSSGNCALIDLPGPSRRLIMIDAGLSPRRTRARLELVGARLDDLAALFLTHLDSDHWFQGWADALPPDLPIVVHERHTHAAWALGVPRHRTTPIDRDLDLPGLPAVRATLARHDDLGSCALRFLFHDASLGYATDVGLLTRGLVDLLRGVDTLAIESNYCPRLQADSDRPEHLKRRITGGRGHLSNEESRRAVDAIAPRRHVVLLHLSRQCNRPEIAASHHANAPYALTISRHDLPTGWIDVGDGRRDDPAGLQWELFECHNPLHSPTPR